MVSIVMLWLCSAGFFYVDAIKSGMQPRRWAMGGLILGPLLLPMFGFFKHITWRKSAGYGSVNLKA